MTVAEKKRQECEGFLLSEDVDGRKANITRYSSFQEATSLLDAAKWLIGALNINPTIAGQQVATVAYYKGCDLKTRAAGAVEVNRFTFGTHGQDKVNEVSESIRKSLRIDREAYTPDGDGLDYDCLPDETIRVGGPQQRMYATYALQYGAGKSVNLAVVRCRVNIPLGSNGAYHLRRAMLVSLEQALVAWIAPFDPVQSFEFNLKARNELKRSAQ